MQKPTLRYVQDVRYAVAAWMRRSSACTGCTVCCGCMDAEKQRMYRMHSMLWPHECGEAAHVQDAEKQSSVGDSVAQKDCVVPRNDE